MKSKISLFCALTLSVILIFGMAIIVRAADTSVSERGLVSSVSDGEALLTVTKDRIINQISASSNNTLFSQEDEAAVATTQKVLLEALQREKEKFCIDISKTNSLDGYTCDTLGHTHGSEHTGTVLACCQRKPLEHKEHSRTTANSKTGDGAEKQRNEPS